MSDPASITSSDRMSTTLQAASENSRLRTFALVDGALLRNLPSGVRRRWGALDSQSLLAGVSDDVAAVGPLLYPIGEDQSTESLSISLCDLSTGRVAGSFILSDQRPELVARRLTDLVDVKLSDGSDMLMRFFDPRVLPFWIQCLPSGYRQYIAGAVVKWVFWKHDFGIQTVPFEGTVNSDSPLELPMNMSLNAETALMSACFPFTMIERLRAEDPVALDRLPVRGRYAFLRNQISRAQHHGLTAQGELEAYCGMAIEFGAAFDEHVCVRAALRGVEQGQTFDEALAALTNEDWQRVRSAS